MKKQIKKYQKIEEKIFNRKEKLKKEKIKKSKKIKKPNIF